MADKDDQQQPLNTDIAVVAANNPRAVSVKLAEFWQEEPALWFAQAEAQFRRGLVHDGASAPTTSPPYCSQLP